MIFVVRKLAAALTVVGGLSVLGAMPAAAEIDLARGLERAGYTVRPALKKSDADACVADGRREATRPENQAKVEELRRKQAGGGALFGAILGFALAGPGGAVAMASSGSAQANAVAATERFAVYHAIICLDRKKGYKFFRKAGARPETMTTR